MLSTSNEGTVFPSLGSYSLDFSASVDEHCLRPTKSEGIPTAPSVNFAPVEVDGGKAKAKKLKKKIPSKCVGCSITAMDSNTFFAMSDETRAVLLALTAYKDSLSTVVDLDACTVQVEGPFSSFLSPLSLSSFPSSRSVHSDLVTCLHSSLINRASATAEYFRTR
jgi:hypothetical protein